MIGALLFFGLVVLVLLWRARRRKAARSVAADGVSLALGSLVPTSTVARHRSPHTRRRWRGSGGAM